MTRIAVLVVLSCGTSMAAEGRFVVPKMVGQPGVQSFVGRTGWVDAYHSGYGRGVSARVREDATFTLPEPPNMAALPFPFAFSSPASASV